MRLAVSHSKASAERVPRNMTLRSWWKLAPPGQVIHQSRGYIVCCDALKMLRCLKDNSADIVFLDPPFNLGKKYGRRRGPADSLQEDEYFKYMRQILERSTAVLKPGGALYLYHLPRWAVRLADLLRQDLVFRHWIAITMKN